MRILWSSTVFSCHSGYGVVSKELISRLRKQGHFIRLATKHAYPHWQIVDGVEVFEGTNIAIINEMLKEEAFDYIFTFWDIWGLHGKRHPIHDKWISYCPIDTEWISDVLAEVCLGSDPNPLEDKKRGPKYHIAMSRHGQRELKSIGLKPMYAPHGVDSKIFRPNSEGRKAVRDEFGWTDKNFVIGSVGLNYGDDRKGFIPLMRAYKRFKEIHPEARLYLHTHMDGKYPSTINYTQIAKKIGLTDIAYPHQASNDIGRIDEEWLNDVYNSFDVFCLPTRGEGFGLILLESQACGVPVITTATTTGPELAGKTGWLCKVSNSDLRYLPNNTFRHEIGEDPILECLESAYDAWKYGDWQKIKDKARGFSLAYDWDNVWDKYFSRIFRYLENQL